MASWRISADCFDSAPWRDAIQGSLPKPRWIPPALHAVLRWFHWTACSFSVVRLRDRFPVCALTRGTAVSRTRGTRRIQEDPARVQEEPCGHHMTREDTALRRFGTVRPRVQILPDSS